MAILESRFFDIRYKFWVHIFELLLVVAAMGLSVPRLFAKNQPRTRANTIALGMVRELLVFIFQRWQSSKANTILNSLEIVFWGAVVFLLIQANISICMGYTCVLSWIVAGIAISLSIISSYTAIVSFVDWRHRRRQQQAHPLTAKFVRDCEKGTVSEVSSRDR